MVFEAELQKILPEKMPRNALLLSITSFLNDISSEMIFPILPIFLSASLGVPPAIISSIEGVAHFVETTLRGASGFASDRLSRKKPMVLFGYSLSALTKPLFAMTNSWLSVLFIRATDRAGKGIRVTPRDALLAHESRGKNMGAIFGFRKMADSMGAVIGPLVCFALLSLLSLFPLPQADIYRAIFLLSVIPALLGVWMLLLIKEEPTEVEPAPIKQILMPSAGNWRNFLALSFLFGIGQVSYALFVIHAVGIGAPVLLIPLLYVMFNLVYAIFAIPSGMMSDKLGAKTALALSFASFALTCIAFALSSELFGLIFAFCIYGIFMASYETVARVYIAKHFEDKHLGSAYGAYQWALGASAIPAGMIPGLLYSVTFAGLNGAFAFGAIISIIGAAGVFVLLKDGEKE